MRNKLLLHTSAVLITGWAALFAVNQTTHAATVLPSGIKYGLYKITAGPIYANGLRIASIPGNLYLLPTFTPVGTGNTINPVDVCVSVGSPFGFFPPPGSITANTNTACIGNQAYLDLAYVVTGTNASTGSFTVQLLFDQNLCGGGASANFFVGGLSGIGTYTFCKGAMWFTFNTDGSVTGGIMVWGTGGLLAALAPYAANFTGTYMGTGTQ